MDLFHFLASKIDETDVMDGVYRLHQMQYTMSDVLHGSVINYKASVSMTWNILPWYGGRESEPESGQTWDAWYFCLSHTWTKNVKHATLG